MPAKLTQEQVVARAVSVHGNKYSYEMVEYKDANTKIKILCPEHGVFEQTPANHVNLGKGCPGCYGNKKMTKESFIEKAQLIHGDFYDYTLVNYKNNHEKVTIKCEKHGEFEQTPHNHLMGRKCWLCSNEERSVAQIKSNEVFVNEAKKVHGDKYGYAMVAYTSAQEKVTIHCPEHGFYEQTACHHISGQGCPKCGDMSSADSSRLSIYEFIEKARSVHGDKYDYSKVDYINSRLKVVISCPDHGDFEQSPESHVYGQSGCPKCSGRQSKPELEIIELVQSLGLQVVHGDRQTIKPLEVDVLVPEAKLAIEFNGNFWHSDQQKPKSYHFDKTKLANDAGYRMIHIWEGDWDNRKEQIKRIIINACGKTNEKPLNARDCRVEEIEMKVVNEFLDDHHIQGRVHHAKIKLGLVHKTEGLVAVMTFGKGTNIRGNARVNAEAASDVPWNLTRYAAKHSVRGGASKMFKAACRDHGLTFIESYSMNDYFTGGMYEKLGFTKTTAYGADYRVYHPKTGIRFKYHWQRRNIPNVLRDIGREDITFNPDKSIDPRTEFEIEDMVGALRLWDSGKTKWTWRA